MRRPRMRAVLGALVVVPLAMGLLSGAVAAAPGDVALADGHFYTEAGGETGGGFAIEDTPTARFWTSFQALGGVEALGYPASTPYDAGGFTYQAVQGALLQWRPELNRALLANTFEQFTTAGLDTMLRERRQVPLPIADDGSDGSFERAVTIRLGWLTDRGIADHFYANPNPKVFRTWSVADSIQLYGLPMSRPEAFGPFVSQRFQRIAFQRWTAAVAGMPAPGTVVRVLGGDLAKEAGLVPADSQVPEQLGAGGKVIPGVTATRSSTSALDLPDAVEPVPTIDPVPPVGATMPATGPGQFPLFRCRASALDPKANQGVVGQPAPEAGTSLQYRDSLVRVEHNNNCWSPAQLRAMGNHRDLADITEVVIHWTGLDYAHSAYFLRRGVSVHWLIPLAPSATQPPLELIDPRNAAWHAGPIDKGPWQDPAHWLCFPGNPCHYNGNVHSLGFENEGFTPPNTYQVGVMTDILATLIREGYPIQLDRRHIVGHREIDSHKIDPGNLDIDAVIAEVRRKLQGVAPTSPSPGPIAGAPDGSAAQPYPFSGYADGSLTGSSGGSFIYYAIPSPTGAPITLRFSYAGIQAKSGAVGVGVYQGVDNLGTLSPASAQPGNATLTVSPKPGIPLTLQVFSYIPQPITYQLTQ